MTVSLNYLHLRLPGMLRTGLMWGAARLPPCSRLPCSSCFLHQEIWSVAMGTWPQEGDWLLLWGALAGLEHPSFQSLSC